MNENAASSGSNSGNGGEKKKVKNLRALNERYVHRMSIVKQAHEAKYKGDFITAIRFYNSYLSLLADIKDVPLETLSPKHFDLKRDLAEMLLISHIYWEQSKILDLSPNLDKEFRRCFNKFLEFTIGMEYQVVNAEMLRKFIRKNRHAHKNEFREAYNRIYIASKKCYIATFCYGDTHPVTLELQKLKQVLNRSTLGIELIRLYYLYSTKLVAKLEKYPRLGTLTATLFARPLLYLLSKIIYYCTLLSTILR
ncbi:MAG: hypothetical protein HQK50_08265 [Oligoflexia bacterium]|nr:hypothetical protein [Oligoflexia bacterium]